jgi:hypothetical protein
MTLAVRPGFQGRPVRQQLGVDRGFARMAAWTWPAGWLGERTDAAMFRVCSARTIGQVNECPWRSEHSVTVFSSAGKIFSLEKRNSHGPSIIIQQGD